MTSISLGSPLSALKGWKKVSARCLDWLLNQRGEHRLMSCYVVLFYLFSPIRIVSLRWNVYLAGTFLRSLPTMDLFLLKSVYHRDYR
jgi:hypothetical protein